MRRKRFMHMNQNDMRFGFGFGRPGFGFGRRRFGFPLGFLGGLALGAALSPRPYYYPYPPYPYPYYPYPYYPWY
ncbi:spore coat protein [Neobacillus niacini]|uniref:spore coat protein n=1 Tax=Neobacillus niacini TaxID=86668 RepID=UPI00358F1CF7